MKKNYKMIITYDGSRYYGWEHQPNTDLTIQGKIETVISKMVNENIEVIGAGRTDAGVHAIGMVANALFDTDKNETEIKDYINSYLPDDISIISLKEASERFHSRYNAVGKTYRYTCYFDKNKPIFDRKYVYRLKQMPDIQLMREAAKYLIGTHDYAAFCSNSKIKKSTIRKIDTLNIEVNKSYITFTIHGTGFLQHMVRIITGTLLEVGYKNMKPHDIFNIIESKNRSLAGPTAPACGLCLINVDYN